MRKGHARDKSHDPRRKRKDTREQSERRNHSGTAPEEAKSKGKTPKAHARAQPQATTPSMRTAGKQDVTHVTQDPEQRAKEKNA